MASYNWVSLGLFHPLSGVTIKDYDYQIIISGTPQKINNPLMDHINLHDGYMKAFIWIMKLNAGPLLKGTTPLDDFRKKYMCAFLPMELRTHARAKTPKPLELRCIFSFFFQVWKHAMLFFCARGIILCSGDGHLVDKAAFRTFWATD